MFAQVLRMRCMHVHRYAILWVCACVCVHTPEGSCSLASSVEIHIYRQTYISAHTHTQTHAHMRTHSCTHACTHTQREMERNGERKRASERHIPASRKNAVPKIPQSWDSKDACHKLQGICTYNRRERMPKTQGWGETHTCIQKKRRSEDPLHLRWQSCSENLSKEALRRSLKFEHVHIYTNLRDRWNSEDPSNLNIYIYVYIYIGCIYIYTHLHPEKEAFRRSFKFEHVYPWVFGIRSCLL